MNFKKIFSIFKRNKNKSKALSLGELIWFGFNYTVGITFTAVFASLIYAQTKSNFTAANLGTHMIWIFLIEGIIAGICAWSFARLSQIHSDSNGASYIYVRTSYKRFWGWFIAFLLYSTLPLVVTSQIVSVIRINFTGTGESQNFLTVHWGAWTNLGLDLIGVSIYALASSVIFLGIFVYKKFVNYSAYMQWGTTAILMVVVIILFFKAGFTNFDNVVKHQNITIASFSKAFISCFFFFCGFETYATIGKNIKNPKKNIGLSLIIVMILSTLFYAAVTFLMIGAISGIFQANPNIQIFKDLSMILNNNKWVERIGIIIMLMCTISLKLNAGMQNALYSGGMLEPLAVEGYISSRYKKLNKDKIPYRAAILNLIITFTFVFIWLIIPDLIQAITDKINGTHSSAVLDYGTITAETSLITITVYAFVLSVAIKLSIQKKMKSNKFELIAWILVFIFMIWQIIEWFIGVYHGLSDSINNFNSSNKNIHATGITGLVSNIIQILYLIIVLAFIIIWYFVYYRKKLKTRLLNNMQKEYDDEFIIETIHPNEIGIIGKKIQLNPKST